MIPPIVGIKGSLLVTLTYLRRHRVQADLAEGCDMSPSTISRAIHAVTAILADALTSRIPTLEEVPKDTTLLVDGTLLPC